MSGRRQYTEDEIAEALSLCIEQDYTGRQASEATGIPISTITTWVGKKKAGEPLRLRHRDTRKKCDICGIVLGEDALCKPDGTVVHPPTPKTEDRCWLCTGRYGDGPTEKVLSRWGISRAGERGISLTNQTQGEA